jgi:hypothetical protein
MKNNSLNKLSVFSLGLLLSTNFIMITDSTHPKPVNLDKFKKNIDFQRSGYIKGWLSHLELKEMQEVSNILEQHRIFATEIFTSENARLLWVNLFMLWQSALFELINLISIAYIWTQELWLMSTFWN